MPILAYCVMPNHFHFVLGPTLSPILSTFMHKLTMTHSKRWQAFRGTTGTGPVYQGRFKALFLGDARHFATVCRYVEQNPVRAGLVSRPEDWPWSSAADDGQNCNALPLDRLPI
jgi:putative transposase